MKKHIRFDWAIKRVLRNKADFTILDGFLSELLKEDVQIESVLESESNKEQETDKSNRVDFLVRTTNGERIIVEIQNTRELDYLMRVLFGIAKVITENMQQGDPYSSVVKVISVSIVYFDLGQGTDYVYHGTTTFRGIHSGDVLELSEGQRKLLQGDSIAAIYPEIYLIKVNQFDDFARDSLDEWIYFFKNSEIKETFRAKGLQEAAEQWNITKLPDDEYRQYQRYLDNLHYEASIAETMKFEQQEAYEAAVREAEAVKVRLVQAEEQTRQLQEQTRRAEEEARQAEEEARQAETQARQAEEEARQFQEQTRQAEEEARQFQEQTRQAEKDARQFQEQTRQAEEKARQFQETTRKAEEEARNAQEDRLAMARRMATMMKKMGEPMTAITQLTGLSASEIDLL